jgi:hypothetical protein
LDFQGSSATPTAISRSKGGMTLNVFCMVTHLGKFLETGITDFNFRFSRNHTPATPGVQAQNCTCGRALGSVESG